MRRIVHRVDQHLSLEVRRILLLKGNDFPGSLVSEPHTRVRNNSQLHTNNDSTASIQARCMHPRRGRRRRDLVI
jgi:hypothetical protein